MVVLCNYVYARPATLKLYIWINIIDQRYCWICAISIPINTNWWRHLLGMWYIHHDYIHDTAFDEWQHSFIPDISIGLAPLQVHYYSEGLPHWYCVGVNTPKRYRQLQVKDLSKVPTWCLEWDSNVRPSGWKAPIPTTEPPHPTCLSKLP